MSLTSISFLIISLTGSANGVQLRNFCWGCLGGIAWLFTSLLPWWCWFPWLCWLPWSYYGNWSLGWLFLCPGDASCKLGCVWFIAYVIWFTWGLGWDGLKFPSLVWFFWLFSFFLSFISSSLIFYFLNHFGLG